VGERRNDRGESQTTAPLPVRKIGSKKKLKDKIALYPGGSSKKDALQRAMRSVDLAVAEIGGVLEKGSVKNRTGRLLAK